MYRENEREGEKTGENNLKRATLITTQFSVLFCIFEQDALGEWHLRKGLLNLHIGYL